MRQWSRAYRLLADAQRRIESGASYEEASRIFDTALSCDPADLGLYLQWAQTLSDFGHLEFACQTLQEAMQLQPSSPILPLFLAQIHFDHAALSHATRWCAKALDMNPSNWHALGLMQLIDFKRTLQNDEIGVQANTTHAQLSDEVPKQGVELSKLMQYANSALQSRALLFIETQLMSVELRVMSLTEQVNQSRQAPLSMAQKYVQGMDVVLTRSVMNTKRLVVAIRYIGNRVARTQALEAIRADESYYLDQTDEAIASFQALFDRQPDSMIYVQRLFELYYERCEFEPALEMLKRACAGDQTDDQSSPWACLSLGELCYLTGDVKQAEQYLKRVERLPFADYRLPYYLGMCEVRQGDLLKARTHFGDACSTLNPGIVGMRLAELMRVLGNQPPTASPSPHRPKPTYQSPSTPIWTHEM